MSSAAPFSPAPVAGVASDALPPYLSNGIVGLRVPAVPWRGGQAVVNGLAGRHPVALVQAVPAVAYPLAGDLLLGGAWLSEHRQNIVVADQRYDFSRGELTSRFRYRVGEASADITTLTFASMSQPSVVAQRTTLEFSEAGPVALRSEVAMPRPSGTMLARVEGVPGADGSVIDGALRWQPFGELSSVGVAYASTLTGARDVQRAFAGSHAGPLRTTHRFTASPGQPIELWQFAALVPERAHAEPDRQATRLLALVMRTGGDELRAANADAWRELWRARPVLLGAEERWQRLIDAAFFYLHTAVHPSAVASANIFGLAQWHDYHYYYGHVMWDVEAFVLPPLLLTSPFAARPLLQYRSRALGAARYNAQPWGYRGAQFPWQSSPLEGEEAAPQLGDAAMYEHHVSMGVAHAFAQYCHATGDERFRRQVAWDVQADVADWIVSRATRTDRGYEIRGAMGIAEREQPADNVAYVNMAAKVALDDVIESARILGCPSPAEWRRVRDGLVIPMDGDVILDHDGYTPDIPKGATPAALCGLFPLGFRVDERVEVATTRFYLDMADRYVGSPMLSALYGAWAARIGDRVRARELLEEGYAKFVSSRFAITYEYRPDRFPDQPVAGPFMRTSAACSRRACTASRAWSSRGATRRPGRRGRSRCRPAGTGSRSSGSGRRTATPASAQSTAGAAASSRSSDAGPAGAPDGAPAADRQSTRTFANTCHARALFATRLSAR